jgi:hypothetical protein
LAGTIFSSNSLLRQVAIQPGVAKIEDSAFAYCPKIEFVAIPATVTVIGGSAFGRKCPLTTLLVRSDEVNIAGFPSTVVICKNPDVAITGYAAILCNHDVVPPALVKAGIQKAFATAASTPLVPEFMPPQEQPRALHLKEIAQHLQRVLFRGQDKTLDPHIVDIIEIIFVPAMRELFGACAKQSTTMVAAMQKEYQGVREGHLELYADTLRQIRMESTFPELQRRSNQLVIDSKKQQRPQRQLARTITALRKDGEAVANRYDGLFEQVAQKTGSTFHKAGRKGLVRICEKLELSVDGWDPRVVCDLVRGAVECENFTTMINVLRLLRDLDADLKRAAGETGGVEEQIAITRSKGRFGEPTSGGWADIMINFSFADDANKHICEVQLVHKQLYTVRKEMGAHKTYSIFRAALELCEKVGANPEEGADASKLEALKWEDPATLQLQIKQQGTQVTKIAELESQMEEQGAKLVEQVTKIAELESQMEEQDAKNVKLAAQMESLQSALAAIMPAASS